MSFAHLYYHIIFRPKNSQKVITPNYEKDLYHYIWGFCKEKECFLWRINSMPDHIHILVELPPTLSVSDFVRDLKIATNSYMKAHRHEFPYFEGWGRSFCALSCSKSQIPTVMEYIKNQKVHHAKESYADELRKIFEINDIPYKEEFLLKD